MKENETKLAFIKARAEGKSYSTITRELGIAKATCTSWEQSLKADIEALKRAQLDELYTSYNMTREARIKELGGIIQGLDNAIATKNLEDLPLDKLLELRLKYGRELKTEYREPIEVDTDDTLDGLLEQYNRLLIESKAKAFTPAEVKAQLSILDAKRATLFNISNELIKEDDTPLSFQLEYTSAILRHE